MCKHINLFQLDCLSEYPAYTCVVEHYLHVLRKSCERKRERENEEKKLESSEFWLPIFKMRSLLCTEVHGGCQEHLHQMHVCIAAMMPFVHFHSDSTDAEAERGAISPNYTAAAEISFCVLGAVWLYANVPWPVR